MKKIINGDWLTEISKLDDESIDFICIDPPYGKIQGMKLSGQKNSITWDTIIDWKKMFKEFKRLIKKGGTIAVFGQQPTYSAMIMENIPYFKYEYIWEKNNAAQGYHSDKMPLAFTENIAIFIKPGAKRTFNKPTEKKEIDKKEYFSRWYSQQLMKFIGLTRRKIHVELGHRKTEFFFYYTGSNFAIPSKKVYDQLISTFGIDKFDGFIEYEDFKEKWVSEKQENKGVKLSGKIYNGTFSNVLKFSKDQRPYLHPTQKPLKLMEQLISTHTNKGDIVLDCFAGSGSTLVAAKNLERSFVGVELDKEFYEVIKKRLKA